MNEQQEFVQRIVWDNPERVMRILVPILKERGTLTDAQWQWFHFAQFAQLANPPASL